MLLGAKAFSCPMNNNFWRHKPGFQSVTAYSSYMKQLSICKDFSHNWIQFFFKDESMFAYNLLTPVCMCEVLACVVG